ncbi:protein kinase [Pendulispora brunnea]|uniref:Protein kinase n=1 Tax=Pendulispora brunnea TaxID=2905690 RepID=A0ABZ2JZQ7_9BACT
MAVDRLELKTIFAERFLVEAVAGTGGMAVVYRALDQKRGSAPVALKVLRRLGHMLRPHERFAREAFVLSTLQHPGIVSYIDHGITPQGDAFLVMEWLEGESLGQRLHRQGLSLVETVTLFRGIAEALSVAHRLGIVHRDIKPENIFLRGGQPERASLLDFGVARLISSDLTSTQVALGTPHYMAPEQARGEAIGPSADVFALGCVMFQCLTGRVLFEGAHPTMVMAGILLNEAPALCSMRPSMPKDLETLLARMLAKDPERRPKDASALLEALNQLAPLSNDAAPERALTLLAPVAPLSGEQQLVSVILSLARAPVEGKVHHALVGPLAEALRGRFGARVEHLMDGSMIATLAQTESMTATDQAVQAARCALFLREEAPTPLQRIVVTTGRGIVGEHLPGGEVMDRAGKLVQLSHASEPPPTTGAVWVDDVTAQLLDARFRTSRTESGVCILNAERTTDESRLLLGKPTPCIGRQRELAQLRMLLAECCENSVSRLAVVLAPPGIGKSHLRREFVRQVQRDPPSSVPTVQVWLGRSDPTRAGAPYGLLWDALRSLIHVHDGEELATQRSRLHERVRRHVPAGEAQFVTEFIGELCRIPFPSETSPRLRSARTQSDIMADQVSAAFVAFVRAESSAHPVLLVLEDLHWGDGLTVRLIDDMLRECSDRPVMVLALARPEVEALHPKLWAERKREDLRLDGLTKKASRQLVTQALGAHVTPDVVERIVEQAGGNALFLEELIRFVAQNRSDAIPDTVIAMLQARLQRLEPELRRVLRAASVYGATFWRAGLIALLGEHDSAQSIDTWLEALLDQELLARNVTSRFLADTQYSFRHALLREAAHGTLTDADRAAGHRAAAAFLESMGERDPGVLAEHFALGGDNELAAVHYARAATEAINNNELAAAAKHSERGLACGATGDVLGALITARGRVSFFVFDLGNARSLLQEALSLLRPGSDDWWLAAGTLMLVTTALLRWDEALELGDKLRTAPCEPEAVSMRMRALCSLIMKLVWSGQHAKIAPYVAHVDGLIDSLDEAHGRAWWELAHLVDDLCSQPNPWEASMAASRAEALLEQDEFLRLLAFVRVFRGYALVHLGSFDAGEPKLRAAFEVARHKREPWLLSVAVPYLALALIEKGDTASIDEAERILRAFLEGPGDPSMQGHAKSLLAEIHLGRGELEPAERLARGALEMIAEFVVLRPHADAVLTNVLRHNGRLAEACTHADTALAWAESIGGCGTFEVRLRVAAFEAHAAARSAKALRILEDALEQLRLRAKGIPDARLRERFLTTDPSNRRTLEEARKLLPAWLMEPFADYVGITGY